MTRKFWSWEDNNLNFTEKISYESWYENLPAEMMFARELNNHKGDITVWINSLGGDVFAAEIIYCLLKSYRGKVKVKIELAASAASLIAMAGNVIEISAIGKIFIHNPARDNEVRCLGDGDEMSEENYPLEDVKENMIEIYKHKISLSPEKISRLMDAGTWFNAQDAVALGLADKIF